MRWRRGDCHWRRQFRWTGRGVSRGDGATCPRADPGRPAFGHDVPLPGAPDRGASDDHAAYRHGSRGTGGQRPARARPLAQEREWCRRGTRHTARVLDDRGEPEFGVAGRMRRARRPRLHQDRAGRAAGRADGGAAGHSSVRHSCSRPACRASLPWATSGPATSSGWRRPSARDRSRFHSSTASCRSSWSDQ